MLIRLQGFDNFFRLCWLSEYIPIKLSFTVFSNLIIVLDDNVDVIITLRIVVLHFFEFLCFQPCSLTSA